MKTIRSVMTSVLLIGLGMGAVNAHDANQHKGKATTGEIVSVASDRFVLKTEKGETTVTLNKDAKIEHGAQAVDKTHLMKGEKVSVFGTKLPSGELVAKEVVIGQSTSANAPGASHKH